MSDDERPTLRVISGDATPEEIAAILAVVTARSASPGEAAPSPGASAWADRSAGHRGRRVRSTASRDGWRTSLWPS